MVESRQCGVRQSVNALKAMSFGRVDDLRHCQAFLGFVVVVSAPRKDIPGSSFLRRAVSRGFRVVASRLQKGTIPQHFRSSAKGSHETSDFLASEHRMWNLLWRKLRHAQVYALGVQGKAFLASSSPIVTMLTACACSTGAPRTPDDMAAAV